MRSSQLNGVSGFRQAFDDIADLAEKVASMPDHRTREPQYSPEVVMDSPDGNVSVTVVDAQVRSLWLCEQWLADADADEVAKTVVKLVNQALEEWAKQHLEAVEKVYPDIKELNAAMQQTRKKLDQAWLDVLAETRT